jgi:hypothetical protein
MAQYSAPHSRFGRGGQSELSILQDNELQDLTGLQIIMIHRTFLMRSFESPLLLFTRTTCVSAAITILRELEVMDGRWYIPIWSHAAYSINAAIILCLHIRHSPRSDAKCARYRDMVLAAETRLQCMKSDEMSMRGSRIIHSLLAREQARSYRDHRDHAESGNLARSLPASPYADHTIGSLLELDDILETSHQDLTEQNHTQLGTFEDWFTQAFGI